MIALIFVTIKVLLVTTLAILLTQSAYSTFLSRLSKDTIDTRRCNNGSCVNGYCTSTIKGYSCICDAGWTGLNCSEGIDNCQWDSCLNGNCSHHATGYSCACEPGWTGSNCTSEINMCDANPCKNGDCMRLTTSYSCSCHLGWTGNDCSKEIDDCLPMPCIHGNCSNHKNGYSCQCEAGWMGFNCSEDIDECKVNPCYHGNCSNLHNSYICHCTVGWMGLNCSQAVTNVALNKATEMSSVYESNPTLYGPDKGVDGNSNQQMYPDFSCFRNSENDDSNPWWRVDLGGVYDLQTVKLYNRLDCCSNRAEDITLTIGLSLTNMTIAGYVPGQISDIETFYLLDSTKARFVQVTMNNKNSFHLCEVEVFGIPSL